MANLVTHNIAPSLASVAKEDTGKKNSTDVVKYS